MKKFKVLMLADNPLNTSGVGCQANHLIEGLIKTGRWSFRVLGGAIRHDDYTIKHINADYIVRPVDDFGTPELLRELLITERPDALFLFNDPRFFIWVWQMADEIRQICPIVYWHVWDNDPYPQFNDPLYQSTDLINCHSHLTYRLVKEHFPEKTNFIPHALPDHLFKPLDAAEMQKIKIERLGPDRADNFVCIWVNRNARRKMPGNVLLAWSQFLDQLETTHGHRNATLLMHTQPYDPAGQNLPAIAEQLKITPNVMYSVQRLSFDEMNTLYNISDCGLNIACFPAGQLVMTKNGMQEIQNIDIGTEVLTHKGRYRPVKNLWTNRLENRSVYKVKSTNNQEISVTGNHRIKAIKKSMLPKNFLFNKNLNNVLDYVDYYQVDELNVGDYVVQYCDQEQFQEQNHVMISRELDEDIAYMLGSDDSSSEFKQIPDLIFSSPESVRRAYLAGMHPIQSNKKNCIRTISNSLARGLKRLLVGLGYVPFLKCDTNGEWGKKLIWTVEWHEGQQHTRSSRMWNVNGKALISRIYSHKLDKIDDEFVYDLEVEEDHTYTTLGMTVSNCHEGFGLPTLEAMQCGRPIIALKTGGLTRQVVDHRDGSSNGIALDPEVRDYVGGQEVPYIYEDHVSAKTVATALFDMYEMGHEKRRELGQKAREYVLSEFAMDKTIHDWDSTMYDTIVNWKKAKPTRKNWEIITI